MKMWKEKERTLHLLMNADNFRSKYKFSGYKLDYFDCFN